MYMDILYGIKLPDVRACKNVYEEFIRLDYAGSKYTILPG